MYKRCEGAPFSSNDYHQADKDAADGLCTPCRVVVEGKEYPTSWELFALDEGDHFAHFYPSTTQCRMCGQEPVVLTRLFLDDNGPYWAWLHSFHPSNGSFRGRVSMVYRIRAAVEICFTYGPEAESSRGRGRIVRLRAEKIRDAVHPEGLKLV